MAYSGLTDFIKKLEEQNELHRIKLFVDPVLEITEITNRITNEGGKALLFENTGTDFPLLINAFGSDTRMSLALGRGDLDEAGTEIENLFETITGNSDNLFNKLSKLPLLARLTGILPSFLRKRGTCQQVIHNEPDLGILPVLKCWPYDGGRYITLPMVHTFHPDTGKPNVGMYRMQILDKNTTAMHWQRHKTGANHFEAWKKSGKIMPVTVTLGGDPVYTYSATAPLPENISEYILAGFLRKKKVELVRCITNEIYVPSDADIVLEGYVDPSEDLVWEGPFGDHTGFYSLADWYPKFHITCITHSKNAVYPATIVGIPPQEDAWLAKATERLFLAPVKMAIMPEILDFHMPDAGIAHNLVIVKIKKSYPGQGMKVLSSLFGAGQMMFSKYLLAVNGEIDIRNYDELIHHAFKNLRVSKDIIFTHGPLDVLDHSSDSFSFGGKAGIDATIKLIEEEYLEKELNGAKENMIIDYIITDFSKNDTIKSFNLKLLENEIPVVILSVDQHEQPDAIETLALFFKSNDYYRIFRLIIVVDNTVDTADFHTVVWQLLGNSDPERDHRFVSRDTLLIDGTIKAYRKGGFPRKWPNVVCSDAKTIAVIDQKWDSLGIGPLLTSPSIRYGVLKRQGKDEIILNI